MAPECSACRGVWVGWELQAEGADPGGCPRLVDDDGGNVALRVRMPARVEVAGLHQGRGPGGSGVGWCRAWTLPLTTIWVRAGVAGRRSPAG
jgi:hypothetical protein